MADKRDALAEDLRTLADDLKTLLQTATTDPKTQKKKERRFRALYTVIGVATTMGARRGAAKVWEILTGEQPPAKGSAQPAKQER